MGITKRLILILVAFATVPTSFVGGLGYMHARKAIESVRMEGLNSIADLKAKKIRDFFARQATVAAAAEPTADMQRQVLDLVQDTAGLGDTGETLIARNKGAQALFIHPLRHDAAGVSGRTVVFGDKQSQPIRYALQGENGSGRSIDYRNEPVLAAWRHIPGPDWGLAVKIDLAEAYAPAVSLKTSVLILTLVTLTMGILVTIAVSRTISTPILSLKKGAEIIGRGNLNYRIGLDSTDEIGELARAFNRMARNLKAITASRDQLNREVERRIRTEGSLHQSTRDLRNRVNELNGLFNLSKLIEQKGLSMADVFQGTVDLIPSAFQHPENTCAEIAFQGSVYRTLNFTGSARQLRADIVVHGAEDGTLTAGCTEKIPEMRESPFLDEEAALIEAIAQRLGKFIERRNAEQALAAGEKRFRDLVENSLTGISIVQENQVVYQNREQERLLGPLPRRYLMGDIETIHPDDVTRVSRFAEALDSGRIRAMDIDFRCFPGAMPDRDANLRWLQCRASVTEYRGKDAILINIMDITQAKQMEHMLRIQDKMASLGRVAAGIAHEIRNPLSGINIYINTLEKLYRKGVEPEKAAEIFRHIQSASGKIESVIRRVIDFSKPTEPKFVMIDINRPVAEAINLTAVTLRKRGVQLNESLAPDLPESLADPQMIEEVILNLINNAADAMRHMEGRKKISVATSVENGHISITVLDSGPGVRQPTRDSIFDPFYTTKPDSTGIGLSICHRIIRDHDGMIDVRTGKWGGAEFVIRIPVKKSKCIGPTDP